MSGGMSTNEVASADATAVAGPTTERPTAIPLTIAAVRKRLLVPGVRLQVNDDGVSYKIDLLSRICLATVVSGIHTPRPGSSLQDVPPAPAGVAAGVGFCFPTEVG